MIANLSSALALGKRGVSMVRVPITAKMSVGLLLSSLLAGCAPFAVQPFGPSVAVLPAEHKSFEVYQQDYAVCKQFAAGEVAGADTQANLRELGAIGANAALGAGLGAAAGGGFGAGIGAATGAVVGAYGTTVDTPWSAYQLQNRYDVAYTDCMYAKGNQIPNMSSGYTGYPNGWGTPYRYYGATLNTPPTPYPQMYFANSGG